MRIDRIINKAKTLGINTGNGTKPEQLESIANNLGIEENNLDLIENKLDGMLSDNEEFLDTPKNTNNEDVVTSSRRNVMNRKNTSDSLKNASNERTQNKVKDASDKMEEINKSKEPVKDVKAENKPPKVNTMKKVGRTGADAAMKIGRATAKGVGSFATLILANPFVSGAIAIIIFILIIFMIFSATDKDFSDGYFDGACNYNNTMVIYNSTTVNLKNFVIGATYYYTKDKEFSDGATKALMIAIKTTTLAVGNYNSSSKRVDINGEVSYTSVDNIPDEIKTKLEDDYAKIERYLFLPRNYNDDVINSLSYSDKLDLSAGTIEKIRKTNGGFSTVLKNVYDNNSSTSSSSSIDTSKPTIFIGDSRMEGMNSALSELNSSNTVAKGAEGYSWFRDTAISSVDSKMTSGNSYNIISWLGVNDLYRVNDYFNKYKELANGKWKNHTIYVVQVGPVNESMYDQREYNVKNSEVQEFNSKMADLISSAGISNLIYLDIGLEQSKIDWNSLPRDGVHYSASDYKMIYNSIMNSTSGTRGSLRIYDLGNFCEFHKNKGGCNVGWWWPIGEAGDFNRGDILTGLPESASFGNGRDYGWRPDHPILHIPTWHNGEDLGAGYGMNVIATRAGTIEKPVDGTPDNTGSGCGNYVTINHGDGYYTRYCHLKNGSLTKYVYDGMVVSQGQIIGEADSTGTSGGHHLHFEIWYGGVTGNHDDTRDPYDFISVDNPRPGAIGCTGNYDASFSGVCRALKDRGLSDVAVAALLGNMYIETGWTFDPSTNGPDGYHGWSYGLVQWHNVAGCDAYDVCNHPTSNTFFCQGSDMQCYCREHGMSWDTVECQVEYLMGEINQKKSVYNIIYGNQDVANMANSFCSTYEVADDCYRGKWSGPRTSNAVRFLPMVQNDCQG